MTDNSENFVSMNFAVKTFFVNHLATLNSSIPLLGDYVTLLDDAITEAGTYSQEASETITGYATQKQIVRNLMTDAMLIVSGGMVAMALVQNDYPLSEKSYLSKSRLDSLRDNDFLNHSDKLMALANPYLLVGLPECGVTGAKSSSLISLTGNFREIIQNPTDQRSEGSSYLSQFEIKIDEIRRLLVIIDNLMKSVMLTHPILYRQYMLDRMIYDNASGPGAPPDQVIVIPAGEFFHALTLPFLESRSFKIKNLGPNDVLGCLSNNEIGFSNPPQTFAADTTRTLLSGTLAPNGDILLFQNTSAEAVTIEITVLE